MENFFSPLKNAWKIPDLRKRIVASFLLLLVYRVVCTSLFPAAR